MVKRGTRMMLSSLAVIAAGWITGCSEQQEPARQEAATEKATDKAAEVVVYSSRKEHLVKPLFDRFKDETGIKVTYITDGEGPLMARLEAEGVAMEGEPMIESYGKFAWVMDPDGRKIELWQPIEPAPEG